MSEMLSSQFFSDEDTPPTGYIYCRALDDRCYREGRCFNCRIKEAEQDD